MVCVFFQEWGADISIVRLLKCFQIGTRGHKRTPLRKQVLLLLHFYPSTTQIPPFDYPTIPRTDKPPTLERLTTTTTITSISYTTTNKNNYVHLNHQNPCSLNIIIFTNQQNDVFVSWKLLLDLWMIWRKKLSDFYVSKAGQSIENQGLPVARLWASQPYFCSILPPLPPLLHFTSTSLYFSPWLSYICMHLWSCSLVFVFVFYILNFYRSHSLSHVTWSLALHLIFVNPPHPP